MIQRTIGCVLVLGLVCACGIVRAEISAARTGTDAARTLIMGDTRGLRFAIREGGRTVGAGVVSGIVE